MNVILNNIINETSITIIILININIIQPTIHLFLTKKNIRFEIL